MFAVKEAVLNVYELLTSATTLLLSIELAPLNNIKFDIVTIIINLKKSHK